MPALLSLALAAPAVASPGSLSDSLRHEAASSGRLLDAPWADIASSGRTPDASRSDNGQRSERNGTAPKPSTPDTGSLDALFARLAASKDATEANGIARLIERRWSRSGSDTADLLMSRAAEAIQAKEYPLGIELLDRVIALRPDWAEAWNKRALAFYLLDDPVSAMADLKRVLTLEPRHFTAWTGLGQVFYAGGDKARAYESFQRALALHPHLDRVKTMVERLTPDVSGREI